MRMRRKNWARPELSKCEYYVKNPVNMRGQWISLFEKKQPLHLELGCGKGVFLSRLSFDNPNINYIGIDMSDDILGVARRNIAATFEDKIPDNVFLTRYNIEYCSKLFDKSDVIDQIYICFCNPWPKTRHHKRRLTHTRQLVQYKEFLKKDGLIYFKTDDINLFEDSIKYFDNSGFKIESLTYDLHNSGFMKNNVLTEHEIMFSKKGIPIKFLVARMC